MFLAAYVGSEQRISIKVSGARCNGYEQDTEQSAEVQNRGLIVIYSFIHTQSIVFFVVFFFFCGKHVLQGILSVF